MRRITQWVKARCVLKLTLCLPAHDDLEKEVRIERGGRDEEGKLQRPRR
jgi:hypothetical protein